MELLHFLEFLYRDADAYIYTWSAASKQSEWYHTTELDRMAADSAGEVDLYYGVGFLNQSGTKRTRAKNTEISGIPGFWVDIDIADPQAHKTENLPPDIKSVLEILSPAPSMLVSSGYGLHAYWVLDKSWIFETDMDRQKAANGLKSFQEKIRSVFKSRGWALDPTHDLARVLRLPNTGNGKKDKTVAVKVIESSEKRFKIEDLMDVESPVQVPEAREERFKRNPEDGSAELVIRNCKFIQYCEENAKILPEPLWQAMLANVARCKNGVQVCHELSSSYDSYSFEETEKKITHVLNEMHPTTCDYIQKTLGFKGCPENGCNIKSPCVWALGKLPRAKAISRAITKENVFQEESIGALALLKELDSAEFSAQKERLKGEKISLRELNRAIQGMSRRGLRLVEGDERNTVFASLPDAPIDLIIPPGWVLRGSGLTYYDDSTEAGKIITACHMPILLTGRMYNITTETEKLSISYKRSGKWKSLSLLRSQALNARKLPDAADSGLPVTSETAKYLVRWFGDLDGKNDLPVTKAVARMGWHGEDIFFPWAENGYVLDMDDGGEVQGAFQIRGSFEEWKTTAVEVRRHLLARLFLACAFAAPMLKILEQRTFMAYVWGNSSGGKTAALIFAMSVWGAPERLMTNFSSTRNAIERWAGYMPDLPLALNERQVAGSGEEKQEWLESIVYLLGEEKGKMRASRTGLQRTASWRTIALGTGEQPISTESSAQGVKTRVLEIAGEPISDNGLAAGLHSISRKHCGHAGAEFIKSLIAMDPDDIRDAAEALRVILRGEYPNHFHVHIDAVVTVCIADRYASEWIFGLSKEEAEIEAYELANELMRDLPTQREISDVERGADFLTNWLAMNDQRFDDWQTDSRLSPAIGFKREQDDNIYIYPEMLRKAMIEAGFSYEKIMREFAKTGKIKSRQDGKSLRYTMNVRHPRQWNANPKMIVLKDWLRKSDE